MNESVLALRDLKFAWPGQPLLLDISELTVASGQTVFLHGGSGSGKSSLLSLLAGIALPHGGSVQLLGQPLSDLSAGRRDQFRADHIGMMFQLFNLLPYLNVRENVLMGCRFSPRRQARAASTTGVDNVQDEAERLLAALGLDAPTLARTQVAHLSVGQQQRVAAARALIGRPELILADEPTSALDAGTREAFLQLLFSESKRAGSAVVFVSHDVSLAPLFDRTIDLARLNWVTGVQ